MLDKSKFMIVVLALALTGSPPSAWQAPKGTANKPSSGAFVANTNPLTTCDTTKAVQLPAPRAGAKPKPADNSYCVVCHVNYEDETLTKCHQWTGVGCETCHGNSIKHSGDEDGITPPDKMFAKPQIKPFCLQCHEKSKLMKQDKHKEILTDLQSKDTCTDCHAIKHRLNVRTRRWDKKTGKLLKDDGVRMMYKNSPATEGAALKSMPVHASDCADPKSPAKRK